MGVQVVLVRVVGVQADGEILGAHLVAQQYFAHADGGAALRVHRLDDGQRKGPGGQPQLFLGQRHRLDAGLLVLQRLRGVHASDDGVVAGPISVSWAVNS